MDPARKRLIYVQRDDLRAGDLSTGSLSHSHFTCTRTDTFRFPFEKQSLETLTPSVSEYRSFNRVLNRLEMMLTHVVPSSDMEPFNCSDWILS